MPSLSLSRVYGPKLGALTVRRYATLPNCFVRTAMVLAWAIIMSTACGALVYCAMHSHTQLWLPRDEADRAVEGSVSANSDVVKVLIVAYYRSGSTLTGKIFNSNPSALYWFEPLAAVAEKWGWFDNWVHPRNFYYYDNGTEKLITEDRRRTLVAPLSNIFSCDLNRLDPSILAFKHMQYTNSTKTYRDCMKLRQHTCLSQLVDQCRRSKVIAVKLIRLHMSLVEELLSSDPGLKVIHLVRDPRGILNSWWVDKSDNRLIDANLLCKWMAKDNGVRKQLESKYPGRLLRLRYEELVTAPEEVLSAVYTKFLGLSVPPSVVDEFRKMITDSGQEYNGRFGTKRKNSTAVTIKWRQKTDLRLQAKLTKICMSLLNELGYDP